MNKLLLAAMSLTAAASVGAAGCSSSSGSAGDAQSRSSSSAAGASSPATGAVVAGRRCAPLVDALQNPPPELTEALTDPAQGADGLEKAARELDAAASSVGDAGVVQQTRVVSDLYRELARGARGNTPQAPDVTRLAAATGDILRRCWS